MARILIVEDEKAIRNVLRRILTEEDKTYTVDEAENGREAMVALSENNYDLVLCDIKMPVADGLEVLDFSLKESPETAVVMISGHGDIETAVDCIRKGAYDFISKPPDLNRLLQTVRNALDRKHLVVENKTLKKKIGKNYEMIGESPAMQEVKEMIEKVAPTEARVLITGPNGSGKELVAHWIHQKSERSGGPMVEVNCAAIPSELIESELFGHKKGAFTSAVKDRKGKFEIASGGTLFLDEIGDMSLSAQAKVLRALQESKITPVGGDKEIKVDVRVVAATNKDLRSEIEKGNFREDLYHRLSVILIKVPPLNDRREDIPSLAEHFIDQIAESQGMSPKSVEKAGMEELRNIDWTGNIRELRNVVERLMILSGKTITSDDVKKYASK
ncbi:MAG: sigma-54 dependent transcriptional regulator [Bacteroidota bacterium]|nr:sigma-54 dependent transcriptional regulator [Bacteroidota bacterium]